MFNAKRLLFGLLRSQMTGSRSHRVPMKKSARFSSVSWTSRLTSMPC